jgi:hypothetical protein
MLIMKAKERDGATILPFNNGDLKREDDIYKILESDRIPLAGQGKYIYTHLSSRLYLYVI